MLLVQHRVLHLDLELEPLRKIQLRVVLCQYPNHKFPIYGTKIAALRRPQRTIARPNITTRQEEYLEWSLYDIQVDR